MICYFHQYDEVARDPPLVSHSDVRLQILSVKLGISKHLNFMCLFAGRMKASLPVGSHWTSSISKLFNGGSRNLSCDFHSRRTLQSRCLKFLRPLLRISLGCRCYVSISAPAKNHGNFYHCIILSSGVVGVAVCLEISSTRIVVISSCLILFSGVAKGQG